LTEAENAIDIDAMKVDVTQLQKDRGLLDRQAKELE
jgi:hypothetical protein